jgi:hypothetical protein
MTYHEEEIRAALQSPIAAGVIEIAGDDSSVVRRLEEAFPFVGSRVSWDALPGHLAARETRPDHADFRKFFEARRSELGGDRTAYYLSDNLLDCTLRGSLFSFERHMDAILSIPAHHYFIANDFRWCIAYTMEGDIDFAWSNR